MYIAPLQFPGYSLEKVCHPIHRSSFVIKLGAAECPWLVSVSIQQLIFRSSIKLIMVKAVVETHVHVVGIKIQHTASRFLNITLLNAFVGCIILYFYPSFRDASNPELPE